MPYRARRRYVRRPIRRRPRRTVRTVSRPDPYAKYAGYVSTAVKAYNLAKWAASMLNPEHKRLDTTVSATPTSGTPLVYSAFTSCQQGDTNSTRNGNSVKFTSIYMRGVLTLNAAATSTRVRAVWVIDKNPEGAGMSWTDLYTTAQINALIAPDVAPGRFRILSDRVYTVNTNKPEIQINQLISKRPFHTKYNGNAGTVADVTRDNLNLLLVSDEATNSPTFSFNLRLKYLDN